MLEGGSGCLGRPATPSEPLGAVLFLSTPGSGNLPSRSSFHALRPPGSNPGVSTSRTGLSEPFRHEEGEENLDTHILQAVPGGNQVDLGPGT